MLITTSDIYAFANRLNYNPVDRCITTKAVDHVNKEYSLTADPHVILFDILFWNTPLFVYNTIKLSFEHQFGCDLTMPCLIETVNNLDLTLTFDKYRNTNLYSVLHPCSDNTLRSDFKKVIYILFCKVFDNKDNFFNVSTNQLLISFNFDDVNRQVFAVAEKEELILSGSLALASYGSVYRNQVHDFDFIINAARLDNNIADLINDTTKYNVITGRNKAKVEYDCKSLFKNSDIFKRLQDSFKEPINVVSAIIDRVSAYDKLTTATFSIAYKNIMFDLMFTPNSNFEIKDVGGYNIKVQDINNILHAKRILGRPKDFEDLINFKPYSRSTNNSLCVVDY